MHYVIPGMENDLFLASIAVIFLLFLGVAIYIYKTPTEEELPEKEEVANGLH